MSNRTQTPAPRRRLRKVAGLGLAAGAVAGLMYLLPAAPSADAATAGSHPAPAGDRAAAGAAQQAGQDLLGMLHWPGTGGGHRDPAGARPGGHPKAPGRAPAQQVDSVPGTPPGGAGAAPRTGTGSTGSGCCSAAADR
ncbi:hypothetical protein ACFYNO_34510 [Kitasatospora sp. NPDC006697]|uniref:hypothetical protein n=1 Tax=Kitasatospora sp. NPDC006697 TaxID=3364020 RepID=UPI0036CA09B2